MAGLDFSTAPKTFLDTAWGHAKDHDEAWKTQLARLTLEELKPSEPVLARITELSKRPGAYFPSNYEDGFSAVIPQVSARILLHHAFWLRAQAEIQTGEGQRAQADVETMLALSRLAFLDFGLPSQVIGTGQLTRTLNVVALGLRAHVWTDDQLLGLEGALGQVDLLAGLIRSVRHERASANALMEQVASGRTASLISAPNETGVPKAFHRALTKGYLLIWGPADQAYASRLDQRVIDVAKVSDWNGLRSNSFDEDFRNPTKAFQLTHIFSELTTPAWSSLLVITSAAQTQLIQALIACALERYFLSRHEYPPTLAELVPSYLPAIPQDIFTGQPMHYEKTSEGFKLWSEGWDGKDDQGQPSAHGKPKIGDWVWGAAP